MFAIAVCGWSGGTMQDAMDTTPPTWLHELQSVLLESFSGLSPCQNSLDEFFKPIQA
jgi:hypothetical protein